MAKKEKKDGVDRRRVEREAPDGRHCRRGARKKMGCVPRREGGFGKYLLRKSDSDKSKEIRMSRKREVMEGRRVSSGDIACGMCREKRLHPTLRDESLEHTHTHAGEVNGICMLE